MSCLSAAPSAARCCRPADLLSTWTHPYMLAVPLVLTLSGRWHGAQLPCPLDISLRSLAAVAGDGTEDQCLCVPTNWDSVTSRPFWQS